MELYMIFEDSEILHVIKLSRSIVLRLFRMTDRIFRMNFWIYTLSPEEGNAQTSLDREPANISFVERNREDAVHYLNCVRTQVDTVRELQRFKSQEGITPS
ncbi:hypothetical protein CEXT_667151 [Caerostris extrusa]|uniref:Uncharacterized protein n=1 Tax=Caerostris extrusa TaxID=172846 RepID=A0AAV4QCZ6_CAEEX|nr:hypothetical protein CEXT_667151 [Caerostris extrusa]